MSWMVEWKEWNEKEKKDIISSDSYNTWEKALEIFIECVKDNLCKGATVYSFVGEDPDPIKESIVLEYRP